MIKSVKINNYRNLAGISAELDPKLNFIIAANGSGKTNFLESLYYSVFAKSFRSVSTIAELIGSKSEYAKVHLELDLNFLDCILTNHNFRITRSFKLNGKKAALSALPAKFGMVIFAPHSVDIAGGEPAIRRADLDDFLSICFEGYFRANSRYQKVLRNRNAVIKQIREGKAQHSELAYWTTEIIELADYISKFRYKFFEEIKTLSFELAEDIYHDFNKFELNYKPNVGSSSVTFKSELENKYAQNLNKEIIVGRTLYGVHKDDYEIKFNEKDLRYLGSRGQQRIGSFILKLSQINYYQKLTSKYVVLLIDDIMSELDQTHRLNIAQILLTLENIQIVLTGAVENEIPEIIKSAGKQIEII